MDKNQQVYLPSYSLEKYLSLMEQKFPEYVKTFQFENAQVEKVIEAMNKNSIVFESEKKGGRGDAYRKSQEQQNIFVRKIGISQLLDFATNGKRFSELDTNFKILDILGGDGTLARFSN